MEENAEMSFWDHLEELRWVLFRAIGALIVFTIVGFIVVPYIYDSIVMAPTRADFFLYKGLCQVTSAVPFLPDFCDDTFLVQIININVASQFFIYISTSFYFALIFTFPYLAFEVWRFVSPALYMEEKKNVRWVVVFGTIMFFIGCLFGYSVVFPTTFRFLATYVLSTNITNTISLDSYMDLFLMLVFIMGVVFELPLVAWLSSKLGLIDRSFFNKFRRHAIVSLLVLSAFITPSSDPFTLSVVFIPLYMLYEISALFVRKSFDESTEIEEETNED